MTLIEIIQLKKLYQVKKLYHEELLNEPPANATGAEGEEDAPKLEIELVDDEPKEPQPLTADVNRVVTPVSKEDGDFTRLISNTQKAQAEDAPEMLKFEAEPEKGNMITPLVVIEGDELDESWESLRWILFKLISIN